MPRRTWRALSTAAPVLLLLAAALPGRAQTLGRFETQDLRLVCTKGGESFLVPHAARTYENSMGFQRRMFDYRPLQKVPVLLFLGLLVFLDSFKLVSLRSVLVALVAGALAALAGTQANGWLLDATGLPTHAFSRYVAPLVEETLKALWIVLLLRRGRVGFLVDAAILGFAVGAGFALVENVEYLRALAEPRVLLWLARGFGTAILHGATTAVFALLAKMLADRHPGRPVLALVPGLLAASTRSTTTSWCRRSSPRASSSSACPSWSSPSSSAASGPPGSGWAWGSTATSSCSSRSLPDRRSRRASASTCAR